MTAAQEQKCEYCNRKPATCFGRYENAEEGSYACDDCCGHGCEDGECHALEEQP